MSTRVNLVVGVDEKGGESTPEALKMQTTAFLNSVVVSIGDAKVAVSPDDLTEALVQIKEFLSTRPAQPKTPQAGGLTPGTVKVEDVSSDFGN